MADKIRLRFISNPTFVSWFVRVFTNSKWSHVDYIFDNGKAYSSLPSTGVNYNPNKFAKAIIIEMNISNKAAIEEFLLKQRGKMYDWKAIVGFPFNRKWNSDEDWFCSELIAAAIECSDEIISDKHHRVTPKDLFDVVNKHILGEK